MQNSSAENGDRPTLPSIWDLFRDELSEPANRHNSQASSSSVHPGYVTGGAPVLPSGQDGRYDGWINHHDHFLDRGHGPSLSAEENPSLFIQHHQIPDAAGPTSYPQPYYNSPQEVNQTRATFDETNPGANYITFRCFPVLETPDESVSTAKYECQHCGKTFTRPSTLRIHLHSHTGEKPFVCPVESCGRGFSVLSNMRRHARIHAQPTTTPEATAQLSGGDTPSRDHQ